MSIHLSHEQVQAGFPVSVVVTATNITNHEIEIPYSKGSAGGDCFYTLMISDETGKRAALTRYGYARDGKDPRLANKPDHSTSGNTPQVTPDTTAPLTNDDIAAMVVFNNSILMSVEPGKTLSEGIDASALYDLTRPGKYAVQVIRHDPVGKDFCEI